MCADSSDQSKFLERAVPALLCYRQLILMHLGAARPPRGVYGEVMGLAYDMIMLGLSSGALKVARDGTMTIALPYRVWADIVLDHGGTDDELATPSSEPPPVAATPDRSGDREVKHAAVADALKKACSLHRRRTYTADAAPFGLQLEAGVYQSSEGRAGYSPIPAEFGIWIRLWEGGVVVSRTTIEDGRGAFGLWPEDRGTFDVALLARKQLRHTRRQRASLRPLSEWDREPPGTIVITDSWWSLQMLEESHRAPDANRIVARVSCTPSDPDLDDCDGWCSSFVEVVVDHVLVAAIHPGYDAQGFLFVAFGPKDFFGRYAPDASCGDGTKVRLSERLPERTFYSRVGAFAEYLGFAGYHRYERGGTFPVSVRKWQFGPEVVLAQVTVVVPDEAASGKKRRPRKRPARKC